jgi:hypothetical protein
VRRHARGDGDEPKNAPSVIVVHVAKRIGVGSALIVVRRFDVVLERRPRIRFDSALLP